MGRHGGTHAGDEQRTGSAVPVTAGGSRHHPVRRDGPSDRRAPGHRRPQRVRRRAAAVEIGGTFYGRQFWGSHVIRRASMPSSTRMRYWKSTGWLSAATPATPERDGDRQARRQSMACGATERRRHRARPPFSR